MEACIHAKVNKNWMKLFLMLKELILQFPHRTEWNVT